MMNNAIKHITPLFLVIFIDAIGMGIIFPILNPLYMSPNGMLPIDTSSAMRDLLYGATLAVFPLFMFFGTPILGNLSDYIGRKKVLTLCLLGVGICYWISAIAVCIDSVALLIASRAIAGLFAGSQATAQAAVIDICPADSKTKYLSLLLLFASLGFIAGPLLGGLLADSHLVSWFGYWTPLFLAGLFALANTLFLYIGFNETHQRSGKLRIYWHQAIGIFADAFRTKNIRNLSIVYVFYQLAWSIYFQYISLLLLNRFHYSHVTLGLFMAFTGLGFATGFIYFINVFTKYFSQYQIVFFSMMIVAIASLFISINHSVFLIWPIAFVVAILMACSYSTIIAMYSDAVSAEKQGWVMGVNNAVVGVSWSIAAIGASQLQNISNSAPLFSAGIVMLLAGILLVCLLRAKKTGNNNA